MPMPSPNSNDVVLAWGSLNAEEIERRLREARGDLDPKFTDAFLFAEWEAVVDYWGIKSWEAYRDAVRVGRGSPLVAAATPPALGCFCSRPGGSRPRGTRNMG